MMFRLGRKQIDFFSPDVQTRFSTVVVSDKNGFEQVDAHIFVTPQY